MHAHCLVRTGRFLLSALAFIALLTPGELKAQSVCQIPSGLKPASQCVDASGNLLVGPSAEAGCDKVHFDRDFTGSQSLKKITVQAGGEAYVADESRSLEVEVLSVAGLFQAGTQDCPIGLADPNHQVILTFLGECPCPSPGKCEGFNKGLRPLVPSSGPPRRAALAP